METTKAMMDQVRTVLSGGDWVEKEHLLQLATNYVLACRAVNEKAYQCRDLLREGLRKDALKLANEAPKLVEEAGILNCPERSAWVDLCESAGLEVRQYDLDAEVVTRVVKDLSTDARKLTGLLKLHRRLALGRAPLGERLRVLRQIARADPQRTFWQDDVRTFETARREELTTLARRAASAQDADTLALVLTELKSPDWSEQPPAALVRSIEQMIAPFRQRKADKQFAALAEQLHQAHGAQREPEARELLATWHQAIKTSGVDPPPALAEGVGAVQAWLNEIDAIRAEEQSFQDACNALRKAVDEERGRGVLEKLAADVVRFGRPIPELLERRVRTRIEELRRRARRRFTLAMTAIVGGLLLVAAAVAAISMWQHRVAERKRLVRELSQAVEAGDAAEADRLFTYLQENDPDLLSDPEILSIRAKLDEMIETERQRKAEFRALMAKVEEAGVEDPDRVSLNAAEKLAKLEEEKILVAEWQKRIEEYIVKHGQEIQENFDRQVDRLEKQVYPDFRNAYDRASGTLRSAYQKYPRDELGTVPKWDDLDGLYQKCVELADDLNEKTNVKPDGPKRAGQIGVDARADKASFGELDRLVNDLVSCIRSIPKSYARPATLAGELTSFGEAHSEHPLSRDFETARGMLTAWQAADDWQRTVADWPTSLRVTKARTAARTVAQRLAAIERHLENHPETPYKDGAEAYRTYLEAAKAAFTDAGLKFLSKTEKRLSNPLISKTFVVKAVDPRTGKNICHYTYAKELTATRLGEEIRFYTCNYINDGTGTIRQGIIKPEHLRPTPQPPPQRLAAAAAPQTFAAAAALRLIQRFDGSDWETFYLRLAELVQKQPDVDPILCAKLVDMLLEHALECSPYLKQRIEDAKRPLEDLDHDVAWMHPTDPEVAKAREQAARALGPIAKGIEEKLQTIGQPLTPYRPVGILLGKTGEIRPAPTETKGTLHVLRQNGVAKFEKIGSIVEGQGPVVGGAATVQGSIVYIKTE